MKIKRKSILNFGGILLLCFTWFAIGWIVRGRWVETETILVERAQNLLLSDYPGPLPSTRELSYEAIRGMLRKIGDPHAALLTPPVSERFLDDFAGQSGVIGLYPEKQGDQMVVAVIFPDEPAAQAGLNVGDIILSVDGFSFNADTTVAEAILLIRGPVGEAAHFMVQRGDEVLAFSPIRQARQIISARMLPGNVAYIAQYTFTTNATEEMKAALDTLLTQHAQGLVWDLRSNGGGSMQAAQAILSYFIEDGLLFTAELKGGRQERFLATGNSIAPDLPVVVLVGERTYSAAETAAATMMETHRGIVIGSTTYGKGTIQTTEPIGQDCLLQFTVAKWLSPNGTWYEERGVTPDILVYDNENTRDDEVLQAALDYLLDNLIR